MTSRCFISTLNGWQKWDSEQDSIHNHDLCTNMKSGIYLCLYRTSRDLKAVWNGTVLGCLHNAVFKTIQLGVPYSFDAVFKLFSYRLSCRREANRHCFTPYWQWCSAAVYGEGRHSQMRSAQSTCWQDIAWNMTCQYVFLFRHASIARTEQKKNNLIWFQLTTEGRDTGRETVTRRDFPANKITPK